MVSGAGGFAVDPDGLDAHGAALVETTVALARAADAARSVALDADAYGVLCQVVPAMLTPVQQTIAGQIGSRGEQVGEAEDGIRRSAARYREADEASDVGSSS